MKSNLAPAPKSSSQSAEPVVDEALALKHKIKGDEYSLMLQIVGRTPSYTELGIFSAMWSEHCSYKSSRTWLAKLPTKAPWVIQGPGENAGVIDIGDGQAAIFKMESHNHPSFIEPFQGAATGVGGILRDVFTMGARPIANLNALRFGDPSHPKTRHLLSGVVAGISHYGNCVGVPTVGGEINFNKSYNGNILVNAMTVGLADTDKIFYSRGATVGSPVIYVGSKTGRDGIQGAVMASDVFDDKVEEQRPTVQVGDPFTEKLLIEACLELMATDAIISIQDMGAAGLTSSSVEIADKGGVGIELNMELVPTRETGMTPYEIMLSESQERMLVILKPGREEQAKRIFDKWELDFAVIGAVTDTGRLVIKMHGEVYADLPVHPLVEAAPKYQRPTEPTPKQRDIAPNEFPLKTGALETLKTMLATPDLCSKRWVYEQYDSLVGSQTQQGPGIYHNGGADAAIVHIPGGMKALAITTDCTPRYCLADPVEGGKQAVAEAWRNITATGATPLAITDNMNFGNPERPRIMGQFADCVRGMAEACTTLSFPVISGNVSLYNETSGEGIDPTPAIGGVGVMKDAAKTCTIAFKNTDETIILVGDTKGHLGQSLYVRDIHGVTEGAPPPVDLTIEKRNGDAVRELIQQQQLTACHDVSDGGLLVAVAEMAMASGTIGAEINISQTSFSLEGLNAKAFIGGRRPDEEAIQEHSLRVSPSPAPSGHPLPQGRGEIGLAAFLFGEDQSRYVITAKNKDAVLDALNKAGVPALILGRTIADNLVLNGSEKIPVQTLRDAHEFWLPDYMNKKA